MESVWSPVLSPYAMNVGQKLKELRERAGLSMDALAKQIGFKGASSYQRYETDYRRKFLPFDLVEKLVPVLKQYGISEEETLRLSGVSRGMPAKTASGMTVATAKPDNLIEVRGQEIAVLPVYDLGLSAGPGAWVVDDPEPLYEQPFRYDWVRSVTDAPLGALKIARARGDSMWQTIHDGDQLLIDTTKKRATREGIYGLRWTDDLMVKRISVDPRNGLLTITSDNTAYRIYEDVEPDSINILGRVIWIGRSV